MVPGGGPSLAGDQWLATKHRKHVRRKQPFLVDNRVLGKCFREKFIKGLRRMFDRGQLTLEGAWSDLLDSTKLDQWFEDLEAIDWNVFVEGPPGGKSDPKNVLKYLARYMAGGPIADSRLISLEKGKVEADDKVTFWARPKATNPNQPKKSRKPPEPFTLKCTEFVRRWTMHIAPKGFTKVRRYGGFSGSQSDAYIQLCKKLIDIKAEPAETSVNSPESDSESKLPQCPRCQCNLEQLSYTRRPSWRILFERIYRDVHLYNPMWHIRHLPSNATTRPPPSRPPPTHPPDG